MTLTSKLVHANVVELIDELSGGALFGIDEDQTPKTTLGGDLGLTSIDFMHLAASIDMRHGTRLRWEDLVIRAGVYISDLSIGDVVDFIVRNQGYVASGPEGMG